jgi:hypothetical protein
MHQKVRSTNVCNNIGYIIIIVMIFSSTNQISSQTAMSRPLFNVLVTFRLLKAEDGIVWVCILPHCRFIASRKLE